VRGTGTSANYGISKIIVQIFFESFLDTIDGYCEAIAKIKKIPLSLISSFPHCTFYFFRTAITSASTPGTLINESGMPPDSAVVTGITVAIVPPSYFRENRVGRHPPAARQEQQEQ
jgi:hypothetical protein